MKGINTKKEDGKILIKLQKEYYEKSAVFSAAHTLTNRFAVSIDPIDHNTVGVCIQPKKKSAMKESEIEEAIINFSNELIDQQIRLDLEAKYGKIRELIVKQAFAPLTSSELKKELN